MDWGHHIKSTTSKAQRSRNILRRSLSGCGRETNGKAYVSLVRHILEYDVCAWNPYQVTQTTKLEVVQRKAARFVCSDYSHRSSTTHLLNTLGWRSLQERRFMLRLAMFYKIVHQQTACTLPPFVHPYTSRDLRASHKVQFWPRIQTRTCTHLVASPVVSGHGTSCLSVRSHLHLLIFSRILYIRNFIVEVFIYGAAQKPIPSPATSQQWLHNSDWARILRYILRSCVYSVRLYVLLKTTLCYFICTYFILLGFFILHRSDYSRDMMLIARLVSA